MYISDNHNASFWLTGNLKFLSPLLESVQISICILKQLLIGQTWKNLIFLQVIQVNIADQCPLRRLERVFFVAIVFVKG